MKILIGDILQTKAQTVINTVNCVGIMGKGVALEFKNRFPEMFDDYVQRCKCREVKPKFWEHNTNFRLIVSYDHGLGPR